MPSERLTRLFYLERGRLRCAVVSEGGSAKTVLYYWPGDICGETHIFDSVGPIPVLVTSVGRSTVRSIGLAEARRMMVLNPKLAEDLMVSMAGKTLAMIDHIRQLRFLTVEARVADFLYRMAGQTDGRSCDLPLTHDEIADYVGAHRVSVTEALQRIEQTGAIITGRGHIVVKDLTGLRQVAVG
jgi:CRP/FNR family transcriptional regulator